MSKLSVLLYVPNLIDYSRLILLLTGWLYIERPVIFVALYLVQAFLDFFDGYYARKLNQVSSFGASLDILIDNLGRGIIWINLHEFGLLFFFIEMLTFCSTQKHGAEWKKWFTHSPFLVRKVMSNNFKNPYGITAIVAGLHGLPIWLYVTQKFQDYIATAYFSSIAGFITAYGVFARLICLYVELWIVVKHFDQMLSEDAKNKQTQRQK